MLAVHFGPPAVARTRRSTFSLNSLSSGTGAGPFCVREVLEASLWVSDRPNLLHPPPRPLKEQTPRLLGSSYGVKP